MHRPEKLKLINGMKVSVKREIRDWDILLNGYIKMVSGSEKHGINPFADFAVYHQNAGIMYVKNAQNLK